MRVSPSSLNHRETFLRRIAMRCGESLIVASLGETRLRVHSP